MCSLLCTPPGFNRLPIDTLSPIIYLPQNPAASHQLTTLHPVWQQLLLLSLLHADLLRPYLFTGLTAGVL
jgi:hypothetical protein